MLVFSAVPKFGDAGCHRPDTAYHRAYFPLLWVRVLFGQKSQHPSGIPVAAGPELTVPHVECVVLIAPVPASPAVDIDGSAAHRPGERVMDTGRDGPHQIAGPQIDHEKGQLLGLACGIVACTSQELLLCHVDRPGRTGGEHRKPPAVGP